MDVARGGFVLLSQDAQQGGLADAVWSDNAEPCAFFDAKGQPGEDVARAVGFCKIGEGDKRHFSFQSSSMVAKQMVDLFLDRRRNGVFVLIHRKQVFADLFSIIRFSFD